MSQPIPISASSSPQTRLSPPPPRGSPEYSPRNTSILADEYSPREPVTCPPQFLPRARQNSQIQLDVFHHPSELHSPSAELRDPFSTPPGGATSEQSPDYMANPSPRVNTDLPHYTERMSFDSARSPVLAIRSSRGGPVSPEDEDGGFGRTISGLSLTNDPTQGTSPRRKTSVSGASETTYVPMTPLPTNCSLALFDRPREMATLMKRNTDLFTLIEHSVPPEKYHELENLWKTPRELVKDEDWVAKTRSVIAMGPVEDEGGALWVRWRDLVGWESDMDEEEGDEYDWDPPASHDTSLHRRWSDLDTARGGDDLGTSGGSAIGVSMGAGVGTGLSEINEAEEEEFEEGERPVSVRNRI